MFVSRIILVAALTASVGCKKDETPAPAPTAPAASAPAKTEQAAKPAAAKPKKSLPAEKKPHPIPGEWTELTHADKGFSFAVPKGSTDEQASKDGFDLYIAKLPAPHDKVHAVVAAYKDAKKTKDDLLKDAAKIIEVTGGKDVKQGEVKELNADYSLADFTFTSTEHKDEKNRVRVLVATDVTDNYLVLVGTDEAHFKESEETIDTIWGSFNMFSGGASGESK